MTRTTNRNHKQLVEKVESEAHAKKHEWKTIRVFAEEYAHRKPATVWWWIRSERLPKYLLKNVQGHLEIDVDAWRQYVEGQSIDL